MLKLPEMTTYQGKRCIEVTAKASKELLKQGREIIFMTSTTTPDGTFILTVLHGEPVGGK